MPTEMEQVIVALRQAHRAWDGRKICVPLRELGDADVPPPGTGTSVLHRHGLIHPAASALATPLQRIELAGLTNSGKSISRAISQCKPVSLHHFRVGSSNVNSLALCFHNFEYKM